MQQASWARKTDIAVRTSSICNSSPRLYVQHLPRSSASDPISKSMEINSYLPRLLLSFLQLMGLVQKLNKGLKLRNVWLVFFNLLLLFRIMDAFIIIIVNFKSGIALKSNILFMLSLFFNLVMWHSLRNKRKKMITVLRILKELCPIIYNRRTNLMVLIISSFPLIYSLTFILLCDKAKASKFYAYGYELKSVIAQIIVICLKTFLLFLVYPTFHLLIAALFCNLCYRCSSCFHSLTQKILQYNPEEFGPFEQVDILKRKANFDEILYNIQNIFSLSSFLLITLNVLSCCNVLGVNLNGINSKGHTISILFYGIPNFLSLIAVLWSAGLLPVEQHKLKEAFYKKVHLRFLMLPCLDEIQCKREILDKPDFVLNGCNILFYKRSSILAAVGALLTYTLLVYQN
ncbi:uncharacterized protein NPIL_173841 [Nephila pilipes]|uniref:Uncharacterized protein n=1 Tax=Nephila pilipes TaxID=299642 RepID=A0A8X6QLL1_NEPPI|nr:uncharacterized protein NPIL_173841 [Nephila pilipes]